MAYEPLTDTERAAQNKSLTDAIGRETEERFFRIMSNPTMPVPQWYAGVRRGSGNEDHNDGADFLVRIKTTAGSVEVAIQVKSSYKWLREFFWKHPGFRGIVIVVAWYMTDEKIQEVAFNKLKKYALKWRLDLR